MYGAAPTDERLPIQGGLPPKRKSKEGLLSLPFKRGGYFFSLEASRRAVYTVIFVLFFCTLFVVVFAAIFTPECDDPTRESRHIQYKNPHYRPGCRDERYLALMGLTPRECDLGRRMNFAIACGAAVGFERRRVDRPAGIRTMSLVALGACIFTITSIFAFHDGPMSWDASRVAAAIPSGVGFLGAGLIWKNKVKAQGADDDNNGSSEYQEVHGLTTAASTWVAASLGIAAGGGLYFVASFGVLNMLFILRFGPRTAAALPEEEKKDLEADVVHVHGDEVALPLFETVSLDKANVATAGSTPTGPCAARGLMRAQSDRVPGRRTSNHHHTSPGVYHP